MILDGFYIFVFNFLLDVIREITEKVDTGSVFQGLDVYDIVDEFIVLGIKYLVFVKEPIAEGIVLKAVCFFIIFLFKECYKEILWHRDISIMRLLYVLRWFNMASVLTYSITFPFSIVPPFTTKRVSLPEMFCFKFCCSIANQIPLDWLKVEYCGCILVK